MAQPPYEVPEYLRDLAEAVVTAVMKAGLPVFDVEADAEEPSTGVELVVAQQPCAPGLQVTWRQHPCLDMNSERWRVQQIAMHEALRAILTAQGYWLKADQKPGQAPTALLSAPPHHGQRDGHHVSGK